MSDTFSLAERISIYAQQQAHNDQPVYADPIREIIEEELAALREQLSAATARARRFEEALLRIAARADDYSGPCIRAHVADALGITVTELEKRLE